jgi:hypothetical protein
MWVLTGLDVCASHRESPLHDRYCIFRIYSQQRRAGLT